MAFKTSLLKRKKWYSLEDAARRLSIEFEEEVNIKDVLQLFLEGEIGLCAFFRSQLAKAITDSSTEEFYTENELFYNVNDTDEVPTIDLGRTVSVDRNSSIYLDGLYRLSNRTYALSRTIQSEITGSQRLQAHAGFWSVEEIEGDGTAFLLFNNDEPALSGPATEHMVILRGDLDCFIQGLTDTTQPVPPQRDSDDLRTLEAMGLLVEAFSKQAPKYQHGIKPNRAAIAKEMLAHAPEDITHMSTRKLHDILSTVLDAWETKKIR